MLPTWLQIVLGVPVGILYARREWKYAKEVKR